MSQFVFQQRELILVVQPDHAVSFSGSKMPVVTLVRFFLLLVQRTDFYIIVQGIFGYELTVDWNSY